MAAEGKAGKRTASSTEGNGVELTTTLYKQLHDLAAARMSREFHDQTLQATALVHEAWLRMRGGHRNDWENRTQFISAAANTMRRILIDRARRRNAIRHGGGRYRVEMDAWNWENLAPDVTERYDRDLIDLDEALKRLSAIDRETEELVELRYFSGMDAKELAGIMGKSRRTIERRLSFARSWLKQDLETA